MRLRSIFPIFILIILILELGNFFIFELRSLQKMTESIALNNTTHLLTRLQVSIAEKLRAKQFELLNQELKIYGLEDEIDYIVLLDEFMMPLSSSKVGYMGGFDKLDLSQQEWSVINNNLKLNKMKLFSDRKNHTVLASVKLPIGQSTDQLYSEQSGVIFVKYNYSHIFEMQKKHLQDLSVKEMVMLVFMVFVLWLLLEFLLSRPLKNLVSATKRFSTGDSDVRATTSKVEELNELVMTFNTMIETIHKNEEMQISQSRQSAMGEMIAMIAHQWRQPLTTITMVANNLLADLELDNKLSNDQLEKEMRKVLDQTKYLSDTVDDFKNFFSPTGDKEKVTVLSVLKKALNIIGKSFENHDIEIEVNERDSVELLLFEKELLQVFLVILNNAKEAVLSSNRKDGKVTIDVFTRDNSRIIEISDNGSGIPEDILKRLGEPYVSSKKKSGTGLGIYMSNIIIKKHMNGTLKFMNNDQGACVEISLPLDGEPS